MCDAAKRAQKAKLLEEAIQAIQEHPTLTTRPRPGESGPEMALIRLAKEA